MSLSPLDIVILAAIAVASVAVCVRVRRKGSCADCAQGGVCSGHCDSSHAGSCPAIKGVDATARKLGRGVK